MSDEHIYKSHNKTLLLYHIVVPVKYRNLVITKEVGESLILICQEVSERYEMHFVEIGYEEDHVHFLIHPAFPLTPNDAPQKIGHNIL